jgi:hypothetical protein
MEVHFTLIHTDAITFPPFAVHRLVSGPVDTEEDFARRIGVAQFSGDLRASGYGG